MTRLTVMMKLAALMIVVLAAAKSKTGKVNTVPLVNAH